MKGPAIDRKTQKTESKVKFLHHFHEAMLSHLSVFLRYQFVNCGYENLVVLCLAVNTSYLVMHIQC